MTEIFGVDEAINLLKEGIVLKDNLSNRFVCKKSKINIYSSNSSYKLNFDDFILLFKDNKFIVEDFDDGAVDVEKDKEYYGFKHK